MMSFQQYLQSKWIQRLEKCKWRRETLNLRSPTLPFFFLESSSASSSPSSISLRASSLFTLGSFCIGQEHVADLITQTGSEKRDPIIKELLNSKTCVLHDVLSSTNIDNREVDFSGLNLLCKTR